MNYEELYQNITVLEKRIKDRQTAGLKNYKNLCKHSESGDLKSYAKDLAQLKAAAAEQAELLAELTAAVEGFDAKAYIDGGDFAEQMVYECRQLSLDVKGESPVYEMFPYKVRIDAENQDVYVDRKKWQYLRPISFARQIRVDREKLLKASFNDSAFANELCAAYDTAVTIKNKKSPTPPPTSIYR